MEHKKQIKIKKEELEKVQRFLEQDEIDFEKEEIEMDSILLSRIVKFDNKFTANLKVCSGQTNCWVESVLFNEIGIEIGVTEPSFDILGEYIFPYEQDLYIVIVEE